MNYQDNTAEIDILEGNSSNHTISEERIDLYHSKPLGFRILKRGMDIVGSCAGLILLSPVFLLTAMAIKIEDKGPAVFIQNRNGLNSKVFRMYKFRSMCMDAPKMRSAMEQYNELDGPAFKMKDDPRITRVGKFIRKTSIDELPQLVNILKGEMSIVGPRPLPTYETEQLRPYYKRRMLVKPGLTCYWQISGRNDVEFDEWMKMDLRYAEKSSIGEDIKIILQTVITVLTGKGAY